MSMQDLIIVESTAAILLVNFDQLKSALEAELEKYNVVVTVDTVSEAKKLATELNKTKGIIDVRRKEEVSKASEPVKQFDAKMEELVKMCADGRVVLLNQVKKFEDETRATVAGLLAQCRNYLFDKYDVRLEFRRAEFDELIKVGALTKAGKLSKSVKDQLQYRVIEDKGLQDRTERRLLELENISLKSGLSAPLTRDHVVGFLFADDDHYQSEVGRIISVEIKRQEQAEIALRKKLLREQEIQKAAEPVPVVEPEPVPAVQAPESQPATQAKPVRPAPPVAGKTSYEVTVIFHVDVDPRVTTAQINTELRKKMAQAGFTTLAAVYIKPAAQSSAA